MQYKHNHKGKNIVVIILYILFFVLIIFSFFVIFWTIKGSIYPNKFKLNWGVKQLPLSRSKILLRGLGLWLATLFISGSIVHFADSYEAPVPTKEELAQAAANERIKEKKNSFREEQKAKEKDAKDEKTCSNDITAFVISQDFIRKNLKAPTTAVFPYITSDGVMVNYLGDCTHEIIAYVDAENSFGAKLRTKYYIKMQNKKGTDEWRVLKLHMDE